jgi:hypothetical protein
MATSYTKTATAEAAAKSVFSILASYLEERGEFPSELVLTIGGCLIEHLDACGDDPDPGIKRLYDACGERMGRMDQDKTVDIYK